MHAAIVGEGPAAQRLRFAAAPDKTRTDRTAELISVAGAAGIKWNETALVVWAAPAPDEATAKAMQAWVEGGGVLLCFPPAAEGAAGVGGVTWNTVESAPGQGATFTITLPII